MSEKSAFTTDGRLVDLESRVVAIEDKLRSTPPGKTESIEQTTSEPTIRVRLQHSHSVREGWRLSETTVEWTGAGAPDWMAIRDAAGEAHEHGADEAMRRNDRDAEAAAA